MKDAGVSLTWGGAPTLPPPSWVALGQLINISGLPLLKNRDRGFCVD